MQPNIPSTPVSEVVVAAPVAEPQLEALQEAVQKIAADCGSKAELYVAQARVAASGE